ncbi:MAG: nicotinamide-nucleotide amidohydrolase family protein [Lentisphaeria bacterium]|nr:nicotinamide-nucleotide amidohydrolase family protein [Lentisphaeria bacterium]
MNITIISTGTELLRGAVVNTNLAEMGKRLLAISAPVRRALIAGDSRLELVNALASAVHDADVLILSGGLGPTEDDVTRDTVAEFFGLKLLRDNHLADGLRRMYRRRHGAGPIPKGLFRQADVPEGAEVLPNADGSAPGLYLAVTYGGRNVDVFLLPGPPNELIPMFENCVLPRLAGDGSCRTLQLFVEGVGELEIESRLREAGCVAERAYCAIPGGTRLFLSGSEAVLGDSRKRVESLWGDAVCDAEDQAHSCIARLAAKGLTLGLAESCTGGMISEMITAVPGASTVFSGGIVAYSNEVKKNVLQISPDILEKHGAVSEPCAAAMAEGAAKILQVPLAGAVTGIAGPGGGTPEKPVGLVWIAVSFCGKTVTRECHFRGGRETVRRRTAAALFTLIREQLAEAPL